MTAYYNENDKFAAEWLRQLIVAGEIAPGDVDERSIRDVKAADLTGYDQCHFFAGIGVWSYALRQAGWPDDRPVWTGSCPCQPFSTAGKQRGTDDDRHLWPVWFDLIRQRRPGTVFAEQVANGGGLGWLDTVQIDLEDAGYTSGAVDLCAAGLGAPHIRQRLWIVAHRSGGGLANTDSINGGLSRLEPYVKTVRGGEISGVGDTLCTGLEGHAGDVYDEARREEQDGSTPEAGSKHTAWTDAEWVYCRDDKWRPIKSGLAPLVDGATARVEQIRGYGNALVAPAAAGFIRAAMSCL
jgi:DNA (cytosine-5)-methyltransferase 1